MALPASQQRILHDIENDLRITDPHLTCAFAAFSTAAREARMPAAERLRGPFRRMARRTSRRSRRSVFPGWMYAMVAVVLLVATGAVLSLSGPRANRCDTAAAPRSASAARLDACPSAARGYSLPRPFRHRH